MEEFVLVGELGQYLPAQFDSRISVPHVVQCGVVKIESEVLHPVGDIFENLPIPRIRFCEGPTRSVMPADLWRGRFTVGSVLEAVVHVLRDGRASAATILCATGSGTSP
ncbi:MAG: hypothetical protein KAY24_05425 [Candidatus Eisenbacteria sp.]|nr:hypothetical protein [Candidatus Eisenbacteria bacterium]